MLLSDPASRRWPLHLTRPSPPSGWPEDLHLQTAEHAQHTTKPRCGIRRALRWSAFHPSVSLAAKPYDLRCLRASASPRLRVSASSSISRTPRDPDPDGTVGVSPCQGDCGRRLRAASEKRGAPIAGCGVSSLTEASTRRPNPRARPASGPHLSKLHRLPVAAQIKEEPDIQPWDRKTWLQRMCRQKNVSIVRSRGRHG